MKAFRPVVPGRNPGFSRASPPKFKLATDCRYSMMPTAPITLPSAGALRSGRNTRRWASRPRRQAISSASTAAGKLPMLVAEADGDRDVRAVAGDDVHPREDQVTVLGELVEHVHRVHGERALGEVDDARALERGDEPGGQHGVEPTDSEAQDDGEEDADSTASPDGHPVVTGRSVMCEARPARRRPSRRAGDVRCVQAVSSPGAGWPPPPCSSGR